MDVLHCWLPLEQESCSAVKRADWQASLSFELAHRQLQVRGLLLSGYTVPLNTNEKCKYSTSLARGFSDPKSKRGGSLNGTQTLCAAPEGKLIIIFTRLREGQTCEFQRRLKQ
jgi:hypothetical protein